MDRRLQTVLKALVRLGDLAALRRQNKGSKRIGHMLNSRTGFKAVRYIQCIDCILCRAGQLEAYRYTRWSMHL